MTDNTNPPIVSYEGGFSAPLFTGYRKHITEEMVHRHLTCNSRLEWHNDRSGVLQAGPNWAHPFPGPVWYLVPTQVNMDDDMDMWGPDDLPFDDTPEV